MGWAARGDKHLTCQDGQDRDPHEHSCAASREEMDLPSRRSQSPDHGFREEELCWLAGGGRVQGSGKDLLHLLH